LFKSDKDKNNNQRNNSNTVNKTNETLIDKKNGLNDKDNHSDIPLSDRDKLFKSDKDKNNNERNNQAEVKKEEKLNSKNRYFSPHDS
jgi:hypothetical protein